MLSRPLSLISYVPISAFLPSGLSHPNPLGSSIRHRAEHRDWDNVGQRSSDVRWEDWDGNRWFATDFSGEYARPIGTSSPMAG